MWASFDTVFFCLCDIVSILITKIVQGYKVLWWWFKLNSKVVLVHEELIFPIPDLVSAADVLPKKKKTKEKYYNFNLDPL